ncbi:MAG: hypothetical protein ACLFQB_13180 [Chitinispirillaceae bacterium]
MSSQITAAGWVFLIGSWTLILSLNVFCFSRIFREKKEDIVDPLPEEIARDK